MLLLRITNILPHFSALPITLENQLCHCTDPKLLVGAAGIFWNTAQCLFTFIFWLFFPIWFGATVFVCKSFKTATSLERSLVIYLGLNPHCSPAQKTFPLSLETWLFSLRPLSYQAGKQHQAMSARNFNCVCSLAYASGKIILYSTTRPLSFVHSNSLDFNLLRLFELQRMKSDLLVCPRQCPTCMAYRLC